jgi:hypothetical protein
VESNISYFHSAIMSRNVLVKIEPIEAHNRVLCDVHAEYCHCR